MGRGMRKKLSQFKAMLFVMVLEIEKMEQAVIQVKKPKRPPHVELKVIKGGKG